jgi:hypothetical protein
MAMSNKSDVLNPAILTDAIQGVFSQKDAFMGSLAVSLGLVEINGEFDVSDPTRIGNTITVPSFGTVGDFINNPDGNSLTFRKGALQGGDSGTIDRDSLGVEMTRWSRNNGVGDPYQETGRQVMISATRAMGSAIMTAAVADGCPTKDYYSATSPIMPSPDMVDDAITQFWGDETDDAAGGIISHSRSISYMSRIKTRDGAYIIKQPEQPSMPYMIGGRPMIRSDRSALIAGSSMGSVTSAGSSPPVITLSGTPLGVFDLKLKVIATGALATWTFQFSTDGGNTWSATITSAASVELTDTAIDSVIGVNGATGITASIASGSASANNTWRSLTTVKACTLVVARGALAFWYNKAALQMLEQPNIAADATQRALHLYRVAVRRKRAANMSKPGVIRIYHNVPALV